MRFIYKSFLLVLSCLVSTTTVFAQSDPLTKVLSNIPHYQRLEGTITVQGYQTDIGLGGGTATAHVQFEEPNSLRVEMKANSSQGTRALVVVAQGAETRVYDPVSRRLQFLPYNVVTQWWRGWDILHGGPANALFASFSADTLAQFYTVKTDTTSKTLNLLATDAQSLQQPDFTMVGGSGDDIFYAPYLQKVWPYASQLNWTFDANGIPSTREEGFPEKVLYQTKFVFNTASHLPKTAVVTDFKGSHVATFTYDLKEVAQPFDKSTFMLADIAEQIPEDIQLKAPAEYKGTDANTLYNRGVASAIGREDYAGAYADWQQASKIKPNAVAPWFALYETSLQTHDLNRARVALDGLIKILGADNEDVLTRQASLASSYLQWKDAEAALQLLIKQQPDNAQFFLALASLYRSQGKIAAERGALGQILAMSDAPAGIQAAAVLNWSLNALTGADRTAGDIEDKTLAQKLVKEIVSLNADATHTIDATAYADSPSLLTALALMEEGFGQRQQAMSSWSLVSKAFPYPLDRTAQWHLLSLAAQDGDTNSAYLHFDALRLTLLNKSETRQFYNQVITTWQTAFRQDAFSDSLKRRALAMQSTPQDAQLWFAFQSNFGSDDDIEAAIKNGATRFSKDAWWNSLRAENLTSLASSPNVGVPGTMSAAEALHAALQSIEDAIRKDPNQPYYQIQKALILRQIAMPNSVIIDPHKDRVNTEAATSAYEQLTKKWPDNADVKLAADIMHLPLDEGAQRTATLQSIQNTMHSAAPLQSTYQDSAAPGGNHTRAFTARQSMAAIARRQGNSDAVSQYYQELLVSARSAEEEQGIALNYLRQLAYAKNTPAIAALLTRLSHEPWKWASQTNMLNAAGGILAFTPPLANDVIQTLQASSDPYAHWAAARLSATIVASLNLVINNPQAPENLQGQQQSAMNSLRAALESLAPVVDGEDKILAARAAASLGESALERGVQGSDEDAKDAIAAATQWFAKAIEIDPSELSYDINLITAFHVAGDDASARAARNVLLTKLTLDPEEMRNAARLTLLTAANPADKALAAKIAVSAFRLAQTSTTTPTSIFWHTGITAARCLMAAGNVDQAQKIYQQLSLPQWTVTDQAVAYLDWQDQLKNAGYDQIATEVQQKLQDLGLNNPQMNTVEWNWHTLN